MLFRSQSAPVVQTPPVVQAPPVVESPKKKRWFIRFFMFLVIAGILGAATLFWVSITDTVGPTGSSADYSGSVRECTKESGQPLQCTPEGVGANNPTYTHGGKCLPTMVNGKAPICEDGGSSCRSATLKGATDNPYPFCLFMLGDDGVNCIPCFKVTTK